MQFGAATRDTNTGFWLNGTQIILTFSKTSCLFFSIETKESHMELLTDRVNRTSKVYLLAFNFKLTEQEVGFYLSNM